jgi:hypothetical protein
MIIHTRCGFEKRIGNKMMTDDQKFELDGTYKRYYKKKMNGEYALLLSPEHRQTPGFSLTQVMPGDFLEVTIKRKRSPSKVKGNLELFYVENGEKVILSKGAYVDLISKGWELIRLNTEIRSPVPAGLLNIAYHFPGESEEIVDDISIRLCRKTK